MRALVTGGAGFIGSHIVDELLKNDFEVVVIDNLSEADLENVNEKARFYKADLRRMDEVEKVFKTEHADFVFHTAAQTRIKTSLERPQFDAESNILAAINLLECCRRNGVKKVIYSSSQEVYGNPERLPVDEKHPLRPISHLGISKHTVEHYLELYHFLYDIKFAILRYSTVYGPRQTPRHGVIPTFFDNLKQDIPCTILGDGEQTRDFVHVQDVAKANLAALKDTKSSVFNISQQKQTSINKLHKMFLKLAKKDVKPNYDNERHPEVKYIYLDNSLAKKQLGWKPKISLEKGLKELFEQNQ
jgi:UDP-glucose 4-epimerase